MKKVMDFLIALWQKYNPFDIDNTIKRIIKSVDSVANKVDSLHLIIARDIAELEYENAQKELILQQIIDSLPDMVWFKDLNGRYVYANKAIKEGLLLHDNPIGCTDIDLALRAKGRYGDDNHTFGEKCANSDLITMREGKPSRFLESGKVKGKTLYLEVFKNVVKDQDGNTLGVCGAGRDLTEYMDVVRAMEKHCSKRCGEADIVAVFKKYEFEG